MTRKQWYFAFFVLMIAVRVHQYKNGTAVHVGLVLEPFLIAWAAFMLPVAPIVYIIERYVFHIDPWADDKTLSLVVLMLAASAVWFETYIARWFGTFTAFVQQFRPLRARSVADAALAFEEKGGTK